MKNPPLHVFESFLGNSTEFTLDMKMIPWHILKTSSRYKKLFPRDTNHIARSDYNFLRW